MPSSWSPRSEYVERTSRVSVRTIPSIAESSPSISVRLTAPMCCEALDAALEQLGAHLERARGPPGDRAAQPLQGDRVVVQPELAGEPLGGERAALLGRALVEDRVLDRARQSLEPRDVATHERSGLRVAQCREPRLALDLLVERLDEHAREVGSLRHFDPFSCE